jgi:hypothetical protein
MRYARRLALATVLSSMACGDDSTSVSGSADDSSTSTASDTNDESSSSPTSADVTGTVSADSSTSTTDTADTSSTGSTDTVADSSSSSEGSTTVADSSSSDGGESSSTGDPVAEGQTINQLVTAGTRSSSASFTLVYTFGQPSQLQSTHTSASYRLQGGLVGANGSPP